jgi:hypothetical protein
VATVIQTITMLTFPDPIPVGSGGNRPVEPWSGTTGPFSLASAVKTDIQIWDDDAYFDALKYKPDDMQTLVADTVIGSGSNQRLMLAGQQISHYAGARIQDTATGNEYIVTFARDSVDSALGGIVGGKTAVFVTPVLPDQPGINLASSFVFVEGVGIGIGRPNIAYQEPETATCFTKGTEIQTDAGSVKIEALRRGDKVLTRDNGFQSIRWIGFTKFGACRLAQRPNLAPILMAAGSLAPNIPCRNLMVSPQHRILVGSKITQRMFDCSEVLVAAKHLVSLPGVRQVVPPDGVSYFHMLFDDHQVVLSNGAWSESLYTGPHAMAALDSAAQVEILALFPHLADPKFYTKPARRLLSGREGRRMAERHARNARELAPAI